jgi:hypothetical protein
VYELSFFHLFNEKAEYLPSFLKKIYSGPWTRQRFERSVFSETADVRARQIKIMVLCGRYVMQRTPQCGSRRLEINHNQSERRRKLNA